jgi:hypothetical protein
MSPIGPREATTSSGAAAHAGCSGKVSRQPCTPIALGVDWFES